MSLPDFKTQIKNIRREAIELGFSISTMNGYECIWKQFIKWKKENSFIYNSDDYTIFLLDIYKFDVTTYSTKSKSRDSQLMRSKKMLDNFDEYKTKMNNTVLPKSLYCEYPTSWNTTIEEYLKYCKDVRQNSEKTVNLKYDYIKRLLSYFNQNGINDLNSINKETILKFINLMIDKGQVSKRRNFFVLRDFMNYLFIEEIIKEDLSIYIPKIRNKGNRRIPTYLKEKEVEQLLKSIPRERKIDIRNYTIILIAARLGLRISDILNIKLKDIDWKNNKINVIQPKTHNLNVLPLSKEVGWAIIDYIKKSRPTTENEYLFVKFKYPYEKMEQFKEFYKYFEKSGVEVEEDNKKGIHNLRHTLATRLLENDIPIHTISSILGHSNINTTNVYLKVNKKKLKECVLEVDV